MVHLGTPSREPMCAGIVGEGEGAAQGGPFKARPSSRSAAEEAIRKARAAGDAFCLMLALASHGVLLVAAGHLEDARAVLEESVERGRAARDTWAMALPLRNLAIIASRCGEHERARELLEDSLRGLRDLGEQWFLSRSIETVSYTHLTLPTKRIV